MYLFKAGRGTWNPRIAELHLNCDYFVKSWVNSDVFTAMVHRRYEGEKREKTKRHIAKGLQLKDLTHELNGIHSTHFQTDASFLFSRCEPIVDCFDALFVVVSVGLRKLSETFQL